MYIEDYSPDLHYIQNKKRAVADTLSRLDMEEKHSTTKAMATEEMCSDWYCYSTGEEKYDSYPLTFQQLDKAQKAVKELKRIT